MKFVKTDDLKPGMRLAKPIYNKNGVLLYDRNSLLSAPGIASVKNFGLFGIYILEPAEPVPPFSQEDLEFEQRQTIYMFKVREIFNQINQKGDIDNLPNLIKDIMRSYGSLDHRVNFNQNLRSADDFTYKHAISTAILIALMTPHLNLAALNQDALICAALLYGFGYEFAPKSVLDKGQDLTAGDKDMIQQSLEKGLIYLGTYRNEFAFFPKALRVMEYYIHSYYSNKPVNNTDPEVQTMASILHVATTFDRSTSMSLGHEPESEIMAMKFMLDAPDQYSRPVVTALAKCIHICPTGASVDLSTGDKGIVLEENPEDFMYPLVLRLSDNQIYDLSRAAVRKDIEIIDIMKTMDNRVVIDENTLKLFVADERIKATADKFRAHHRRTRGLDL